MRNILLITTVRSFIIDCQTAKGHLLKADRCYNIFMIAFELLTWWYRQGWLQVAKNAERRFTQVSHLFSVPILIRTLFAPWRRIVTYPGASIEAKFRAMGDNLVSRVVGFSVRTLVLFTAGVMLALCAVFAAIQMIIWPLLPPAILVGIVKGIAG